MTIAANASIKYESGRSLVAFKAMTDSGDHTVFSVSDRIWSGRAGYEPDIRPDGIASGITILSADTLADKIAVTDLTAYLAGVLRNVTNTTVTITRATVSDYVINSIVLTPVAPSSATLSAIKGVEGSSFITTRGATGGPPYIPVGSIEIGQIKTTSQSSAVILSSEIFQTPGSHQERSDYPIYHRPRNYGYGVNTSVTAKKYAHIEFCDALDLCHTGGTCKYVYIKYYTPVFTTIDSHNGFSPSETTTTPIMAQKYATILGHGTSKINSSGFNAEVENGITDALVALDGEMLIFQFYPDTSAAPFMLTMGILRFISSLPQAGPSVLKCIVVSKMATARFAS